MFAIHDFNLVKQQFPNNLTEDPESRFLRRRKSFFLGGSGDFPMKSSRKNLERKQETRTAEKSPEFCQK